MEIQNTLLLAHLIGAGYVGLSVISAVFSLYQKKSSSYKKLSLQIGVGGAYQLISGSLLALASVHSQGYLWDFCNKISLYIGIIFLVEILLFKRMQKYQDLSFPTHVVISSLTFAVLFVFMTILRIYITI